jgi:carbon storage regulator
MHMLVLGRRPDEAIVIDGITRIVIIEVKGQTVKLGITAPREVRVLRSELQDRQTPSSSEGLPGAGEPGGEIRTDAEEA